MKRNGYYLILFMLCVCSCSSSRHRTTDSRVATKEHTESEQRREIKSVSTQEASTKAKESLATRRVRYEFDTTQPCDPTTGLPPLSAIEVEETEIKGSIERDEKQSSAVQDADSSTQSYDKEGSEELQQEEKKEIVNDAKPMLNSFIVLAVVILLIVIAIIVQKYVRPHTQQ